MANESDEELRAHYDAALYEARTPRGLICIRPGYRHDDLDVLLRQRGADSWCFITAWNPRSRRLEADENRARNEKLRTALDALRLPACFMGVGRSSKGDWQEDSFLALGIDRATALRLGRAFNQNAVVWGERGGVAELLFCFDGTP